MVKLKLNLLTYRLSVNLRIAKRRGFSWKRAYKRTKRAIRELEAKDAFVFIKRLFAHKNVKKVLGTNLALMAIATSFLPTHPVASAGAEFVPVIAEAETVLKTERGTQYPVESVRITQRYQIFHPGIDLDGVTGDPIRPIKKGKVSEVSYSKFSYGNSVMVDHGNELVSLYAHLSEINVSKDQEVTTETVIGKMGATGRSFGDHLHLEVRDHGHAVNPVNVLPL